MGLAEMVDAPVLFAQLMVRSCCWKNQSGQARVKGLIVNKFRGDKGILEPGTEMPEQRRLFEAPAENRSSTGVYGGFLPGAIGEKTSKWYRLFAYGFLHEGMTDYGFTDDRDRSQYSRCKGTGAVFFYGAAGRKGIAEGQQAAWDPGMCAAVDLQPYRIVCECG